MSDPPRFLLDVNVLVALVDPLHVCHEAAHAWLKRRRVGKRGLSWASCPLTTLGVLRVLANPAYPGGPTPVADVARTLRQLRMNHPDHQHWSCELDFLETKLCKLERIQGHKQLTDIYLLALCLENHGKLATFDTRIGVAALVRQDLPDSSAEDFIELLAVD